MTILIACCCVKPTRTEGARISVALTMSCAPGVKAPLDYSVLTAAAAAFLLGVVALPKQDVGHAENSETAIARDTILEGAVAREVAGALHFSPLRGGNIVQLSLGERDDRTGNPQDRYSE
jgi:hypothetical protein